MGRAVFGFAALLASGCWMPTAEMTALDLSASRFTNDHLQVNDIMVAAFDTDRLTCPDGEAARFFVVYPSGAEAATPVAVVLHDGAFDYLTEGIPGDLETRGYHSETRLTRNWAIEQVWRTLGLAPDQGSGDQGSGDTGQAGTEDSTSTAGALAASLANNGFTQLYPANCWGDLWHNEGGYQDNQVEADGFSRNGRAYAWWMLRFLSDPDFAVQQGFELDVGLDSSRLVLVGLGDGGRGVTELLLHDDVPTITAALVDGPPDDLQPFIDDPLAFQEEITGISRIFREEYVDDISDWSLRSIVEEQPELLPTRTAFVWSSVDPTQPHETMSATAATLEGLTSAWVYDSERFDRVSVADHPALADAVVGYLMRGEIPDTSALETATSSSGASNSGTTSSATTTTGR